MPRIAIVMMSSAIAFLVFLFLFILNESLLNEPGTIYYMIVMHFVYRKLANNSLTTAKFRSTENESVRTLTF